MDVSWQMWAAFLHKFPKQTVFNAEKWQQVVPAWLSSDYYAILECSQDASAEEVKKQALLLSRRWHPDKQATQAAERDTHAASSRFQQINEAMTVLRDVKLRPIYNWVRREMPKPVAATRKRTASECAASFTSQPPPSWKHQGWTQKAKEHPPVPPPPVHPKTASQSTQASTPSAKASQSMPPPKAKQKSKADDSPAADDKHAKDPAWCLPLKIASIMAATCVRHCEDAGERHYRCKVCSKRFRDAEFSCKHLLRNHSELFRDLDAHRQDNIDELMNKKLADALQEKVYAVAAKTIATKEKDAALEAKQSAELKVAAMECEIEKHRQEANNARRLLADVEEKHRAEASMRSEQEATFLEELRESKQKAAASAERIVFLEQAAEHHRQEKEAVARWFAEANERRKLQEGELLAEVEAKKQEVAIATQEKEKEIARRIVAEERLLQSQAALSQKNAENARIVEEWTRATTEAEMHHEAGRFTEAANMHQPWDSEWAASWSEQAYNASPWSSSHPLPLPTKPKACPSKTPKGSVGIFMAKHGLTAKQMPHPSMRQN